MNTLRCPKCGKEIPEGSSFCPECGTKLNQKTGYKKYIIMGAVIAIALLGMLYIYGTIKHKRELAEIAAHNEAVNQYENVIKEYTEELNNIKSAYKSIGDMLCMDSKTNFGFGLDEQFNMNNTYSICSGTVAKIKESKETTDKLYNSLSELYIEDEYVDSLKGKAGYLKESYEVLYNFIINKNYTVASYETEWNTYFPQFEKNLQQLQDTIKQ